MHFSRKGRGNAIKTDAGMPEIYKKYIAIGGDKEKYTQGIVGRVLSKFNERMMNKIIHDSYEFKMPLELGLLYIRAHKMTIKLDKDGRLVKKHIAINWDATKKLWASDEDAMKKKILVYHFNDNFDRKIAKYHYEKRRAKYKNKNFYKFEKSRLWAQALAKAINDEETDVSYVE